MKNFKQVTPIFKIGDVAKLKSGGFAMTVHSLEYLPKDILSNNPEEYFTGYIECVWFIEKRLEKATFSQDALEIFVDTSGVEFPVSGGSGN